MAAQPFDPDVDRIRRRHNRTGPDRERTDRNSRTIVHAIDLIDREAVHQAVPDHRGSARTALFRRLKDTTASPAKFRVSAIAGRAEQHRGVAVMATGMHLARRLGRVDEFGLFRDRQRVHIGTQPDYLDPATASRLAALDDADDAGLAGPSPPRRNQIP